MTHSHQLDREPPTLVSRRRVGRFDWWIAEPFQYENWVNRLAQPQQLLESPAEPLKQIIPGREVVRVRLKDPDLVDLVVKRFIPRGLVETAKCSWRVSRALRAFRLARQIAALGFFTALPIAAGERRQWGLLRESFLLTRFIPNATPLHSINAGCADPQRRRGIVCGLARLYAALHDAGFCHHDPSQANFLVVPQPGGSEAIALIDLDGLRQRSEMNLTASAQDLRRLLLRGFIPRRERAWFLVTYSRSRKSPTDARQWVELVGPLPAQATFPHCALDENSRPVPTC
jgi:hypothetical protein